MYMHRMDGSQSQIYKPAGDGRSGDQFTEIDSPSDLGTELVPLSDA